METSAGSPRERGVQALRAGRVEEAIDLLAQAVAVDGRDAEAHAFLGVACSQKGLHTRARQALQSAVALAPRNPHYQFNLGVALERAGDLSGAAAAYHETLVIHPPHPHARARLQGLGAAAGTAGAGTPGLAAPVGSARPVEAPWLRGQLPGTAPQAGRPGSVRCPRCGEWQKPALSCEFCSASLPVATRMAAGPARLTGLPGSEARGDAAYESFSLLQGLKDWARVLVAPQSFFRDQEGRAGMVAPLAILLVYAGVLFLAFTPLWIGIVSLALRGSTAAGAIVLVGLGFGALIAAGIGLVLLFAWTGLVHLACKLLRGEAGYAGSFRAVTYGGAPMALVYAITSLIGAGIAAPLLAGISGPPRVAPGSFGTASLLIQGLTLAGLGYAVVLLAIGTFHIHRLNPGAASAAVVLAVGVGWGAAFLLTRPLVGGLGSRNPMLAGRRSTTAGGPQVGQLAPDFTLVNTAGRRVRLAGLRGKVVFVNFWASWCPPCRAEAPHLEDLNRKYGRQGLVILGLSIDRDRQAAIEFARRTWSYPVLLDAGSVAGQYGVASIPATFVIGRDGRITARHDGYARGMEQRLEDEATTLLGRALLPRRPAPAAETPENPRGLESAPPTP